MKLAPLDFHLVFSHSGKHLKVFDHTGRQVLNIEARGEATGEGYGHNGRCPPGEYGLSEPLAKNEIAFGRWFIPLFDLVPDNEMALHDRAGIGIHGGGSGLDRPYAPRQGWVPTHGCIRLQNRDLAYLVVLVRQSLERGGKLFLTVSE